MRKLTDLVRKLPVTPGVYQFFDTQQNLIYIGKAKNLKKRVQSYFRGSSDLSPKNQKLRAEIADLKWLVTENEVDALVLEANLVRQFQPKFNVLLRDDKNFLYFKITREDFPRLLLTRKLAQDHAKYFGPKTDARAIRRIFQLAQKLFQIRTCKLVILSQNQQVVLPTKTQKIPCLDYDLKICSGPCINAITKTAYHQEIQALQDFLQGHVSRIRGNLETKMHSAAQERQFELAAKIRDQLAALKLVQGKTLTRETQLSSRDVLGIQAQGKNAFLTLLVIREGRLSETKNFLLKTGVSEIPEILQNFLIQYLTLPIEPPTEILLPAALPDPQLVQDFLQKKFSQKIKILLPQQGRKEHLLQLAAKNAAAFAIQHQAVLTDSTARTLGATQALARLLKIKKSLKRIEGYDISHLAGTATVGSLVTFLQGEPQNSAYRHFQIRTLHEGEIDDCASLVEVLQRRMSYLISQNQELKITSQKITTKNSQTLIFTAKIKQQIAIQAYVKSWAKTNFYVLTALKLGAEILAKNPDQNLPLAPHQTEPKSLNLTPLPAEQLRQKQVDLDLIAKILTKIKFAKIYCLATQNCAEHWARFKFQPVRQVPPMLSQKFPGQTFLVRPAGKLNLDPVFGSKPDLVVLDGGKPQLSSVLKKVVLPSQTKVIGLAKKQEEIWHQNSNGKFTKIVLAKNSLALQLLQRLRDEAHRFANRLRENKLALKK